MSEIAEPKIKALAPWFGSKRTLAPRIVAELGPHRAYWEPFCGSMAVLLGKQPATMETVNDLHGELINLARVLRNRPTADILYDRLLRTLCSEVLYREAAQRCRDRGHMAAGEDPDIDRAEDFFLCSWLGMNGVAGTKRNKMAFCRRFTKSGGHAATRFVSAIESIPEWHERLRSVVILNADGFELLSRIEDATGVCIYCDPPYLAKSDDYVHDFARDDHKRLADALGRFQKTRVIVSYYDDPCLDALYAGWSKVSCPMNKAMANPKVPGGKRVAPEILLINGPSFVDRAAVPAGGLFAQEQPA